MSTEPYPVGTRIIFDGTHVGTVIEVDIDGNGTCVYRVDWDDGASKDALSGVDLREWFSHDELKPLSEVVRANASEVETSWASLRLEPGFQQLVKSVASSLRVAYYHGAPEATLDTSENPNSWLRMAEAAVKEIWFA